MNQQAEDYAKLFAIFKKHEDVIERVTFWGLNDGRNWRRGQHPLLFDADNQPKPAYDAIMNVSRRGVSSDEAESYGQIIVIEDGGTGLKGQQQASRMFLGDDSELNRDDDWTIETKNFDR